MEENMKVNFNLTNSMDSVYMYQTLVLYMKDNGNLEKNMEKVF
jgi:hypothetical protein